jgi:uncharacterized membrane protein
MFQFICHILHIAATCVSLGGLFYSRVVLLPNLKFIPEEARENYLNKMIKRFAFIKWVGIIVISVTGIIQWLSIYPFVQNKDEYLLAFALKMAGAFGLLSVTFLLALPNERLSKMQQNRAFWSAINIICGITILVGAAWMREIRLAH